VKQAEPPPPAPRFQYVNASRFAAGNAAARQIAASDVRAASIRRLPDAAYQQRIFHPGTALLMTVETARQYLKNASQDAMMFHGEVEAAPSADKGRPKASAGYQSIPSRPPTRTCKVCVGRAGE